MPKRMTIISDANGFAAFRPQIQKPKVDATFLPDEFSALHEKEILSVEVTSGDDGKKNIEVIYR